MKVRKTHHFLASAIAKGTYLTASDRLADAEATASADHRRAQRDSHAFRSSIYPLGAEFALCHAESQLMSAVVGVLTESLTESIKGFYKLRKAFMTLDGLLEAETRFMSTYNGLDRRAPKKRSVDSLRSNRSARSMRSPTGAFEEDRKNKVSEQEISRLVSELKANDIAIQDQAYETSKERPLNNDEELEKQEKKDEDGDGDEFYDAEEDVKDPHGSKQVDLVSEKSADFSLVRHDHGDLPSPRTLSIREGMLTHNADSDVFANPIDVFIHSGANLCFGMLLLMISMIPPAFGKLLFIIGFRGDRGRGLRMLWQASKFHNINGAMAGLVLLGYYNTIVGFSDIIPVQDSPTAEDAVEGYPKQRCIALLADMRIRHPQSHLWLLEEARMQAANRDLSAAIHLLQKSSKSPLKQVEALDMFEVALDAMYMHDYTLCANSFIACVSLNNWSHALYYYIAGAAHIELYRHYKSTSPRAAAIHAQKAISFLKEAPKHAGKKKFMARQLPFDVFVTRKLNKWEHRAQEWKIPLVDAVGVSPIEEMIFLWNGYKRMNVAQLEDSLAALAWSENLTLNPTWSRESLDERAILSLLRGGTLRNLERWDQATQTLQSGVLSIDKAELKGGFKDDWTAPAAHYEMGVICWMRKKDKKHTSLSSSSPPSNNLNPNRESESTAAAAAVVDDNQSNEEVDWVKQCESWIDKAARWESYELDARIGLKITTAQDTLKNYWTRTTTRST